MPIGMAASGLTKPAAGVMATSPTTAPVATPSRDGRPWNQPRNIQVKAAAHAAVLVATKALAASPPAVRALPALKPNQPNQSSAAPKRHQRDIVWAPWAASWIALARAQQHRQGQRRDTGVDVDHRAAGKVQRPQLGQPAAAAPHPVRHRAVDEGEPQDREDQQGAELDPLHHRAGDQGHGDDGEHALEHHEGQVRDGRGIDSTRAPAPRSSGRKSPGRR